MPILNHSTKVDSFKTAGDIQAMLAKAGARSVMLDYDNQNRPAAIAFRIEIEGELVSFYMPANPDGVLAALRNDKSCRGEYRNEMQAQKVAWRILKDWIAVQLALVESQQAEVGEVFFSYAQTNNGERLYHRAKALGFSNLLEHKP